MRSMCCLRIKSPKKPEVIIVNGTNTIFNSETECAIFNSVTPAKKERVLYYGCYDFDAPVDGDLSFRKGDKLWVEISSQDTDWWVALNSRTEETGFIPSTYVCRTESLLKNQEWYFDVKHDEANMLLTLTAQMKGTFLIRNSGDRKSYVLSIRDFYRLSDSNDVKHYRIWKSPENMFYIRTERQFSSMDKLIKHYSDDTNGLCCLLTQPCPRVRPVIQFRELEVKRDQIEMVSKIDAGHFGEVWKAKWRGSMTVAVKKLKGDTMPTSEILAEGNIMHKLRHRNLVQLLAVCTDEHPVLLITEFMLHGSLLNYLQTDEGKLRHFSDLLDFSCKVAAGMAHLEKYTKIIHRDLRAANILLGSNFEVKIADFGLAKFTIDIYECTASLFPVKWSSPESLLQNIFSIKSDVWSFGVVLYEIFTYGRTPYPNMTKSDVKTALKTGYRMSNPHSVADGIVLPPEMYNLMLKCWEDDPKKRLTFEALHNALFDFTSFGGQYVPSADHHR